MKKILFLEPIFKEMIWGGNKLSEKFGYDIPGNNTGECWAVAAHKNGDCRVLCDGLDDCTLRDVWKEHREWFGNLDGDVFPLLVKIIDAKADLSIQVHPDDEYAQKYESGSLGKTECWYVLDCEEDATIVIGHNAKTADELKKMIAEKRWSELLREQKIKKGDFFQIEPGCIHAIKAGTMILETQQNSDITYRLYDYDRLSTDGKPRELHTKKALEVVKVPYREQITKLDSEALDGFTREVLVQCPYYSVERIVLTSHAEIKQDHHFMNVSVIDGTGMVDGKAIKKGAHFILPFGYGMVRFSGNMELMISYIS